MPAPYLSPKTFAPFGVVQKSHGFIPNFFRAQTLRPDLLEAELQAVDRILVPEDLLTRVQKECILLAVSAANLNSYCVAMHCNLLRGLGMSSEEGDQIAVDYHESKLSEADKALLDFAVKLGTRGPGLFSRRRFQASSLRFPRGADSGMRGCHCPQQFCKYPSNGTRNRTRFRAASGLREK